ncbi:MAG TPA: thioredoxin family protein [Candidatus Eisenbacteria bacterium]|jgi:thiol-disulfide isomerase/thioredoxin|nr:thioredoxin family protein [Candidatus Eisenbacteria bacterium]
MGILDRLFRKPGGPVTPQSLGVEGRAPEFKGLSGWINTPPLTMSGLRGSVVLVDFWTYSCVNCVRTLPYVRAWHEAYKDKGLVIIGVHTPEFEFERDRANVEAAVKRFGITYPVAVDNDYAVWNAYKNRYWPAHYFIDVRGDIRSQHFGEGGYDHSEQVIRALLQEKGSPAQDIDAGAGVSSDVDLERIGTPETYLGFQRQEYLGSPESVRKGVAQQYTSILQPAENIFYFDGMWEIADDYAVPRAAGAAIIYRFTASKAHLVMDAMPDGARARVTLDGRPLGAAERGADVAEDSTVAVKDGRMYDIVDLRGKYGKHLLRMEFLDPGVKCYAFTFG